jgi:hypothetical protein
MALINDLATLRKFVKFAFTTTEKNLPDIAGAEREYLLPILGLELLQKLRDQVTGNNITWPFLIELCRAVIAPLAFYNDLSLIQTSIEDSGLKTTSSDHKEAAHQWEYKEVQATLVGKGSKALEMLIDHLVAKGSDYNWTDLSVEKLIFKTGKEFAQFVYLNQPNLTFHQLKPLVAEVQDHFIKSGIGEDLFENLITASNPSTEEKKAILLIKKTVANYTIARATERLPVKITPAGVLVSLDSEYANATAGDTRLSALEASSMRDGESYYLQLKEYLNKAASATVFKEYFNSELYTPKTERPDGNDSRRGIAVI